MSAYQGLARYYDGLTRDVEYGAWLDWYRNWFRRSAVPVELVLDLACGTGTLTEMLAQAGYSVIGADQSAEMLAQAMEKSARSPAPMPMFLNQSMDRLDLYGTVDACVSSLDSLNYVTEEAVLRAAFGRIHTFLMPGGYFLFDVLSPEHLQSLDGQVFVDETEDVYCVWRAEFDAGSRCIHYGMDLFERQGAHWSREQEEHTERAWSQEELSEWLFQAGFSQVQVYAGAQAPVGRGERLFFVCTNGTGGQTEGQV